MMAPEEGSYWERACQFFRSTGFAESEGSYFIHNKNTETVKIGIRRQISVSVGDGNVSRTVDGQTTIIDTSRSDQPVFKIAESLLRKDAPCFFVVSPDMHRRSADNSIPQIHLVQPVLEFTFSPGKSCGEVTYAQDSRGQQQGEAMLIAFPEQPCRFTHITPSTSDRSPNWPPVGCPTKMTKASSTVSKTRSAFCRNTLTARWP